MVVYFFYKYLFIEFYRVKKWLEWLWGVFLFILEVGEICEGEWGCGFILSGIKIGKHVLSFDGIW